MGLRPPLIDPLFDSMCLASEWLGEDLGDYMAVGNLDLRNGPLERMQFSIPVE